MASARTKLLVIALVPVSLAALFLLVRLLRPSQEPGAVVEVSGPMPVLEGTTRTGEKLDPASYRGKVVVVNFWASWCSPCREEQPALEGLWREYEGRVQFLGVNYRDDDDAAREYLREFDVTYPSVEDRDGSIGHRFGVPYLPATILADRAGQMRYRLLGVQSGATLRGYIEELLGET